jgi:hypothetical protein
MSTINEILEEIDSLKSDIEQHRSAMNADNELMKSYKKDLQKAINDATGTKSRTRKAKASK